MNDTTSIGYYITGGMPINMIIAAVLFALMGLALVTSYDIRKGMKSNPDTSNKLNWEDFGWDSVFRIFLSMLITMIVIFVSIRFVEEYTGVTLTMGYAFMLGMGIDKATQLLVKRSK